MQESSTYMAILDEGIAKGIEKGMEKGIRETLLRLGEKRFGKPSDAIQSNLESIHDVDQLQTLIDRLLDVASWNELVGK